MIRTYEEWLKLVRLNGWDLQSVPEQLKTYELCWEAVKQNGSVLQFVPEELKTPELCSLAVKQKYSSFAYMPKEFKDGLYVFTTEKLLKKYTREELLTSSNPYLRELGRIKNK
jgi:hypothetical protein